VVVGRFMAGWLMGSSPWASPERADFE
jgi:hypothetical protein